MPHEFQQRRQSNDAASCFQSLLAVDAEKPCLHAALIRAVAAGVAESVTLSVKPVLLSQPEPADHHSGLRFNPAGRVPVAIAHM
ncbi:MAG TPA: hypothetical protein VFF26_14290 [Gallionella sp.]|nr:hypothetical protein [Gallionella sp.]